MITLVTLEQNFRNSMQIARDFVLVLLSFIVHVGTALLHTMLYFFMIIYPSIRNSSSYTV